MTATLAAYAKGHQLPPLQLDLSDEWVRRYVEAVEDSTIEHHPGSVPPMALAVEHRSAPTAATRTTAIIRTHPLYRCKIIGFIAESPNIR